PPAAVAGQGRRGGRVFSRRAGGGILPGGRGGTVWKRPPPLCQAPVHLVSPSARRLAACRSRDRRRNAHARDWPLRRQTPKGASGGAPQGRPLSSPPVCAAPREPDQRRRVGKAKRARRPPPYPPPLAGGGREGVARCANSALWPTK